MSLIPLFLIVLHLTANSYGTRLPLGDTNTDIIEDLSEKNSTEDPCGSGRVPINLEKRLQEELESTENESNCRGCAGRKANLTRAELRELRFEVVKQQILQKLQLTRPPCATQPRPSLRALLQAAEMMGLEDDVTITDNDDNRSDTDGKAKSVLAYPLNGNPPCINVRNIPCSRLRFELSVDLGLSVPSSAAIWLYKRDVAHILKLTELLYDEDGENLINQRDLIVETGDQHSRLVKFQLPLTTTTWLQPGGDRSVLDVQISCYSGCNVGASPTTVISDDGEEMPFLVVNFRISAVTPRARRSVDCVEDSIYCCRETLYISFTEIGWDDWILAPSGYEANFCKGKCRHDVSNARFHHSTVLHRYIHSHSDTAEDIGLKMCCTPSRLSNLSIIYNNNGTIIKTTLLNMKVEACDCA